jgi:DNA polymerase-1
VKTELGNRLHINDLKAPYHYLVNEPITVDIEDDEKGGFVGIGLTNDGKRIDYITNLELIRSTLESAILIGHNFKYDIKMLRSWGVNIQTNYYIHDTKVAAHILDSTADNSLKALASRYLNMEWCVYDDLVTGQGKKKQTLEKHPIKTVAHYCGCDVLATYLLHYELLTEMSEAEKSYYENEMKLQRMTLDMEERGVKINLEYLNEALRSQSILVEKLSLPFSSKNINPNSPKQLLPYLQKIIPSLSATNEKALLKYKQNNIINSLLKYRHEKKILSTYIKALLRDNKNGRIHGEFKITGTWTGRLSSSGPNLQNQPRGPLIRTAFIPEEEEHWGKLDYNQLELRMLGHLSEDPSLLTAFSTATDLHTLTAAKIFNIPIEKVTAEQRHKGKTINFSIGYGTTEFGLADQLQCSKEKARDVIDKWWTAYIGAYAYRTRIIYNARKKGYIETISGIRRKIPGIDQWCGCQKKYCTQCWRDKALVRELMTAVVQGSSADIVKAAMTKAGKYGYIPLLQVHDELDFSFKNLDDAEKVKKIMETVVDLKVPLVVDVKIGRNWGSCI